MIWRPASSDSGPRNLRIAEQMFNDRSCKGRSVETYNGPTAYARTKILKDILE